MKPSIEDRVPRERPISGEGFGDGRVPLQEDQRSIQMDQILLPLHSRTVSTRIFYQQRGNPIIR